MYGLTRRFQGQALEAGEEPSLLNLDKLVHSAVQRLADR